MKLLAIPLAILLASTASSCSTDNSGANRETHAQMIAEEQASVAVGMPAVTNYTEKRQLKAIYELRDRPNLVTYTYTIDMQGKRHRVCPTNSVGFGIPYATQYTAPLALSMGRAQYPDGTGYGQSSGWTEWQRPQPEPNALHMPSSAEGTWVICVDPKTKELAPTYVEPRVVVYTFEMPAMD